MYNEYCNIVNNKLLIYVAILIVDMIILKCAVSMENHVGSCCSHQTTWMSVFLPVMSISFYLAMALCQSLFSPIKWRTIFLILLYSAVPYAAG